MDIYAKLRESTLAARKRCGDDAIGSCVARGLFRVVRVTYPEGRSRSEVEVLAGPFKVTEAIAYLDSLGADHA